MFHEMTNYLRILYLCMYLLMYVFIYLFYSCYSLAAISYFQQSFPFKETTSAHTADSIVDDSAVPVTPKKEMSL